MGPAMADVAGDVKDVPAKEPEEATPGEHKPPEAPADLPPKETDPAGHLGGEAPDPGRGGSGQEGTDKPGPEGHEQEESEAALSPGELAASIQERSQIRRSGLESLAGTALFGEQASFSGPASISGHAAGHDVNIFYGGSARALLRAGPVGQRRLNQVREVHVAGANYSRAMTILSEQHLLVLVGAARSGRRTTALHMLTDLTGEQVHVIDAQIVDTAMDLPEGGNGFGYFAEITTRLDTLELTHTQLAALGAKLRQQNAHLILIASRELTIETDAGQQFAVEHRTPDSWEVLLKHVQQNPSQARLALSLLETPLVRAACKSILSPGSAAELATKVLSVSQANGSADEVLAYFSDVRRQQIRHILLSDTGGDEAARVETLCRRALLVSLAVFTDMSYVDATTAAEALAARFISREFPDGRGYEVFTRREYLRSQMDFELTDDHVIRRWGKAATQRAAFRDPELRTAVLDELWHEYDRSLTLLLEWLRDLAVNAPAPEVRVRSAQVIGTLAVREFAFFCDQVLLGWAMSPNRWAREAAATSLETIAVAGKMNGQISNLLTEWCRHGTLRMQQTAVLALGTRISESALAETLDNLRQLALRSNGRNSGPMRAAVRDAVSELYSGRGRRDVILTLFKWAGATGPATRRLARQCMAPLIHFSDNSGRPSLLQACADAPDLSEPVGVAVASLLDEPETPAEKVARRDAWETLEHWVRTADQHHELLTPLAEVLTALRATSASIDDQLRFYLSLWAFRHSGVAGTELPEES
jgi:hypothetical protein